MRRIEEVMPLDIPRYLADTADLDNATSGAYLHALMHQWLRGPLPNDMEICAQIMKLRGLGSKDIARAILTTFFSQLENATWIQKRGAALKAEATAKAIRFNERSKKASAVRWKGHVAKYPPRNASRIPSSNPQALHKVSNWITTGTTHGIAVLQVPEVQEQKLGDSLRSSPEGQPQAAGSIRGLGSQGENRAKTHGKSNGALKMPQDAPAKAGAGKSTLDAPPAPQKKRAGSAHITAVAAPNGIKPKREPDPRFVPFRKEVKEFWKKQNPGGLRYAWDVEDGRVLNALLRKHKNLDLEHFKQLLRNRAASDSTNPAEPPTRWIADLGKYGAGPLDRFNRLK